ncbi:MULTISPECIES: flagella synthesis protein FlgN [unclassified Methylophilus]|jgi:flagellar biosynthesis protein FlgN|uniref:flagella synthesis protein FlgN n=1 Tax=unclassified Methylophilus TaxID=2630143 RepID=UPI000369A013|nr:MULTISPECIES: flagellar protein FlgN [unclassified Methylophilus]
MTTANHLSSPVTFEKDAALVSELLSDLQSEQSALVTADLDVIERMVDKRVELLQALGAAANSRYDALAAAGFEPNEQGMSVWLQKQSSQLLDSAWVTFQQELTQAKELNRLNGILINKHFLRNQEKLDALNGKSSAPQFYGKNGQAHRANSSRSGFSV